MLLEDNHHTLHEDPELEVIDYAYYECPKCGPASSFGILPAAYAGGWCRGSRPRHPPRAYVPAGSERYPHWEGEVREATQQAEVCRNRLTRTRRQTALMEE